MNNSDYYDDLLSSADVAELARIYLTVTHEVGDTLFCDCPQHSSQSQRSLHVNIDKQMWHCFGCGEGGDVLQLVEFVKFGVVTKQIKGEMPRTHRESRDILAKIVGMPFLGKGLSDDEDNPEEPPCEPSRTFECLKSAIKYYHNRLMEDEQALDWLIRKYGFRDETIERFKIGYAFDKPANPLMEFLTGQGFSQEEALFTGLFVQRDNGEVFPFFAHRVTFPYWSNDQVVYVAGRATPWTSTRGSKSKYTKLPAYHPDKRPYVNPCIRNDRLFNEDCLWMKPSRVLVPEGMPDILSVLETGEAAVSPITVRLKKADQERLVQALRRLDVPVILVPDNELSQVGLKGAISTARALQHNGVEARITVLPLDNKQAQARAKLAENYGINESTLDQKRNDKERSPEEQESIERLIADAKIDANEYLKDHTHIEFRKLIDAALTPIDLFIDALSPDLEGYSQMKALKPIMEDIAVIDPFRQDAYLKALKAKTGMAMGTLKQYLKDVRAEINGVDDEKETTFQKLLRIFDESGSEAFLDEHGTGWVRMKVDNHWENIRIESPTFRRRMLAAYVKQEGTAVGRDALTTFGDYLEAEAEDRRPLFNRFAWMEDKLYIDLGKSTWECIEVTPDGWSIIAPERPIFKRFSHQLPLPEPVEGGDVRKILRYVPLRDNGGQTLYLVWLVTCPLENVHRPGIILNGLQGSAKSTGAEITRLAVDPSSVLTLSLSKDVGELVQMMDHHALVNLDNLSGFPSWAGDALCRAVTGSGFSKRALYTDDEDFTYGYRRTFILNGIGLPSVAPDLLDRSIVLHLDRIPKKERKERESLMKAFEADRPSILGGILDALCQAMRIRHTIELSEMPRMADWFKWGCAVAQALEIPKHEFEAAYYANVGFQHHEIIGAEPVSEVLTSFLEDRDAWSGSKSELYTQLTSLAEENKMGKRKWPQNTASLMRKLNSLSHNLAEVGIVLSEDRDVRSRNITITKTNSTESAEPDGENIISSADQKVPANSVNRVIASLAHDTNLLEMSESKADASCKKAIVSQARHHVREKRDSSGSTDTLLENFVTPAMLSLTNDNKIICMPGDVAGGPDFGHVPVIDSGNELPDSPTDWPEVWKEEFYTLSGHINDDRSMSWEEADRIAEQELRRRHRIGNYSWQR